MTLLLKPVFNIGNFVPAIFGDGSSGKGLLNPDLDYYCFNSVAVLSTSGFL